MPPDLPIPMIAVVGSRHSGKTTTVAAIVKGLTAKGYKIATAKHIHQSAFTIDTEGRDTWRHAQAGAQTIIAVAPNELTTIKKLNTAKLTLDDITENSEDNIDIIIIEGFRSLVAQNLTIPKIVTVKNKEEIDEATRIFKPILAFTGVLPQTEPSTQQIPLIDIKNEPEKLTKIIDKRIGPIIKKKQQTTITTSIHINGHTLSLNPYVQKVTRNVVFGVISTLKGANIKGTEDIQIKITNPNESTNENPQTRTNHHKPHRATQNPAEQKTRKNNKKQSN